VTRFVAVASRDPVRAQRFAAELGLEASFGSYEALLASDLVDAVYVALPVSLHTTWTLRALQAGKHVLCEKPFATDPTDAARCFDAAEAAGRVVVEGFMWRHHPQTVLARRLLAEGAIGRLATIWAALSVAVGPGDIRRSPALGGGALYDLGCYCVAAARLFGGHPTRVWAEPVLDDAARPDGEVDLRLAATMALPGEVLALFDVGLDLTRRDQLELVGTGGRLALPDPWRCRAGTPSTLPSWLAAITRPMPALKPASTGEEMKSARNPSRSRPAASRSRPTSRASSEAVAAARSGSPTAPASASAPAARMEMVEVELTLSGRELPTSA
jgi:xylose dehydrogenase (NAD/NADP)